MHFVPTDALYLSSMKSIDKWTQERLNAHEVVVVVVVNENEKAAR